MAFNVDGGPGKVLAFCDEVFDMFKILLRGQH